MITFLESRGPDKSRLLVLIRVLEVARSRFVGFPVISLAITVCLRGFRGCSSSAAAVLNFFRNDEKDANYSTFLLGAAERG